MRSGFPAFFAFLAVLGSAALAQPVPPFVITQPTSVSTYPDEQVTLSATIGGDLPITYQWRKDGVAITGATYPILGLITSIATPIATYDLVATNAAGSVTTMPAVVFVQKRPQTITFTAPVAVAPAGSGIVLNATASSGLTVVYVLASGAGTLSGNVLVGAGGNLVIRATQPGNITWEAAAPVEYTIQFVAGALSPFITTAPSDQTALAGTSLSLRTIAIGTPAPVYQWQKDGVDITGATSATLTFASLTLADTARYTIKVSNLAGAASATAQVTVRAAPVIVTPPASQTINAGNPMSFSVVATGYPAVTYQWRRNGTAITGATSATYSLTSAVAANAGNYDVVVTNSLGTTTSPAAVLTIITRDFSGTYWGSFGNSAGDAVLYARNDGTAAFFGQLPALSGGFAELNLRVDLSGRLTGNLTLIAATTRTVAITGTIDEVAGTVSGTIADLGITFAGTRAVPRDPPVAQAGLYTAALVGSGASRGFVVVAADARAFMLTASGTTIETAKGALDSSGRLVTTTSSQAAIDLGFADGALRGTVRLPTGTGTIAGAGERLAGTEHVVNLSVRGVTTPAAPMITGFAIGGTVAKQVLIRAAGPALGRAPFNLTGVLTDPTIQLFRVNTAINQNNDWGSPASSATAISTATTRAGAFPFVANSQDSALLTTLDPGVYTVQIGGGQGIVLAEIYEVPATNEAPGARRLVNASTRGAVAPGFPLIAGFVISGTAPQRVLIRAAGPALAGAPFNLPETLPNPQLTLYRGSAVVRTNDDWFRESEATLIRDAAARVRAFAFGSQSLDAAVLTYLEPGAYTVVVSGPPNATPALATGLVLTEIYEANP